MCAVQFWNSFGVFYVNAQVLNASGHCVSLLGRVLSSCKMPVVLLKHPTKLWGEACK